MINWTENAVPLSLKLKTTLHRTILLITLGYKQETQLLSKFDFIGIVIFQEIDYLRNYNFLRNLISKEMYYENNIIILDLSSQEIQLHWKLNYEENVTSLGIHFLFKFIFLKFIFLCDKSAQISDKIFLLISTIFPTILDAWVAQNPYTTQ